MHPHALFSQEFPIVSFCSEDNIYTCEISDKIDELNEMHAVQIIDSLRNSSKYDTAFLACCYHQLAVYSYKYQNDVIQTLDYNKKSEEFRLKFDDGFLWKTQLNMGVYYYDIDEYKLATQYLLKALSSNGTKEAIEIIMLLRNLGNCYAFLGDFEKGIVFGEKAAEFGKIAIKSNSNFDLEHINHAKSDLAATLLETFDIDKIEFSIQHSKQVINDTRDKELKVISLNNLARAYEELKNFEKALDYYNQALSLSKKDTVPCAIIMNNIAVLNIEKNLKADKAQYYQAINTLNESLNLYKLYYISENNFDYAMPHENLGDAYTVTNQLDSALLHYQKALINLTNNFRDEDSFQNPNPKDTSLFIYSYPHMIRVLHLKGTAAYQYYQQNDNIQYLNLANQCYQTAFDFHDQLQKDISTENSRLFQAKNIVPYIENALKIAHQQQQNGQDVSKTAFRFMEKNKATVLLQSMNEANALQFANLSDSLIEQEKDLKIAITFHKKQLNDAIEYTDSIEVERLNKALFDEKQRYSQLIDNLEKNHPEYYRLKYQQNQIELSTVQNDLDDKSAVLEYFVGDSSIYVLAVQKEQSKLYKIKKPGNWSSIIDVFRNVVSLPDKKAKANPYTKKLFKQFSQNAYTLFQLLLKEPYTDLNNNVKHLKIIPDAELNYIPFDILLTQVADTSMVDYKTLPYLLKEKSIGYNYSAALMMEQKQTTVNVYDFFYGGYAAQYLKQDSINIDLPEIRQLVARTADFFKGKAYLNEAATKVDFLKDTLSYNVLHFAMHGILNDLYPLNSHLVFTQKDDFKLYAADLYNLKLNTGLAVLSACDTGTGELQKGEGVMSLSRAFTYAGCNSLVMSLWSIPEKSSVKVLQNFFKDLKKETTKDVALQQAKLNYLENTSAITSHPVYWAGLVLTGNNEAMHFENVSNKLWWAFAFLFILFGGFFIFKKSHTS